MRKTLCLLATCSALAFAAVVLPAVALAKTDCAKPDEIEAFQQKVHQMQLMVGALSCGKHSLYNKVVNRHAPHLDKSSKVLQTFFKRRHESQDYGRVFADFLTALANKASNLGLDEDQETYCAKTTKSLKTAMSFPKGEKLSKFYKLMSVEYGVKECNQTQLVQLERELKKSSPPSK